MSTNETWLLVAYIVQHREITKIIANSYDDLVDILNKTDMYEYLIIRWSSQTHWYQSPSKNKINPSLIPKDLLNLFKLHLLLES